MTSHKKLMLTELVERLKFAAAWPSRNDTLSTQ